MLLGYGCVCCAAPRSYSSLQMLQLMLMPPGPQTPGLVFTFSNVSVTAADGTVSVWNDTSGNGLNGIVKGVEQPTYYSTPEALSVPLQSDLDLWLTFDPYSLTSNPNTTYPTSLAPPAYPAYVLDRSGNNHTASVSGNVTFGNADDGGGMSAVFFNYSGVLSVPAFVGKSWSAGFTATVYFKRTGESLYQTVFSNGLFPQSSFEFQLLPATAESDDMMCYVNFAVSQFARG